MNSILSRETQDLSLPFISVRFTEPRSLSLDSWLVNMIPINTWPASLTVEQDNGLMAFKSLPSCFAKDNRRMDREAAGILKERRLMIERQ